MNNYAIKILQGARVGVLLVDLMCHLLMPIAKRGSRGKAEVQLGAEGTYGCGKRKERS
jgi:hypothetical protein